MITEGDYLKVLFKNMGFGGGAPRSLLQYVRIVKKNNIDVVVVGQHTYEPVEYKRNKVRLIDLPYFEVNKPLKSFWLLLRYLKIIKEEKPDIIHTTTLINCYFHKIISSVTHIPIIYNIPGGKVDQFAADILDNEELLVYSDENKMELVKYGYDSSKISVISNRIETSNYIDQYHDHYESLADNDSELQFLLISRFSDNHVNSINYVMNLVQMLNLDNVNVRLEILGDGKHYKHFLELANKINAKVGNEIIRLHGFKHNVLDFIEKSHIVFGKGRSVLNGVLNSRISFVVSENKTISHCNNKTFDNLKRYNFSGRNLEEICEYKEFRRYITNLLQGYIDLSYIKELKQTTSEFYDIRYAEDKIMNLYKKTTQTKVDFNPSYFKVIKEYIKLYYKMLKVKRNLKKKNSN